MKKTGSLGHWIVLLLLLAAVCGWSDTFCLVRDGAPLARIQQNPNPGPLEFRAAEELQKYLQAVSGAWIDRTTFPGAYYRANEDAPETVEIVLGTLDNSRRLLPPDVRDFLAGTEYDDAYCLATTVDADGWRSLFIVGKTDAGVLYGTYAFLEDYVGCRFFHALPGGEHVPKRRTLELPDIHEFRQPWVK